MPNNRRVVTEEQWLEAVEAYELGTQHAVQIARELGVSSSTVSREFKRRGCVKARRVAETVAALEDELDAKARREALRRAKEAAAAADAATAIDNLMRHLVKALVAAERSGKLSAAAPEIDRISKALKVKPLR